MKHVRLLSLVIALVLCLFAVPASADQATTHTVNSTVAADLDLPSSEELFAYYVEREMYGMGGVSFFGTAAYDNLTARQQSLYDLLESHILAVAAGSEASAVVAADTDKLNAMGYPASGTITTSAEAAMAAFGDAVNTDLDAVITALLMDYPYDLYWYDKVTGSDFGYQFWTYGDGTFAVPSVSFAFQVAKPFQPSGYDKDAPAVNTAATGAATTAAANAQKIVDKYASATDYDKIIGYIDEICALTSYNTAAAENDSFTTDSNPWQMLYVFDGDSSTTVVCEGYAKAFQYLCDMTTFDSSKVESRIVTGQMAGGTGAGGHMWNVVTMEDGWNYLVDVTNSDAGTIGQDGEFRLSADAAYVESNAQYTFFIGSEQVHFVYDAKTQNAYDYEKELVLGPTATKYAPVYSSAELSASTVIASGEAITLVDCTIPAGVTLTNNGVLHLVGDESKMAIQGVYAGDGDVYVNGKLHVCTSTTTIKAYGEDHADYATAHQVITGCDNCPIGNQQITSAVHAGGTATCTAQAECADCGVAYGALAGHSVGDDGKCTVCQAQVHVARIGSTGYATLTEASNAANQASGATITLLADVQDVDGEIRINSGSSFTLDLNGKTLTGKRGVFVAFVEGNGKLTVTDSAEGGRIDGVVSGIGDVEVKGGYIETVEVNGDVKAVDGEINNLLIWVSVSVEGADVNYISVNSDTASVTLSSGMVGNVCVNGGTVELCGATVNSYVEMQGGKLVLTSGSIIVDENSSHISFLGGEVDLSAYPNAAGLIVYSGIDGAETSIKLPDGYAFLLDGEEAASLAAGKDYTVGIPQYTVTYDANGGTAAKAEETVNKSVSVTLPTPVRDGYTFMGWKDAAGKDVFSPYTPTASVTLTAQWEQQVASVTSGGETSYYTGLEEAFDAANQLASPTITLLADVELVDVDPCIVKVQNMTLDLNGKTLSALLEQNAGEAIALQVNANMSLTITDGSAAKTGRITGENVGVAVKAGTLTVDSGSISGGDAAINMLDGSLTIKGSAVLNTGSTGANITLLGIPTIDLSQAPAASYVLKNNGAADVPAGNITTASTHGVHDAEDNLLTSSDVIVPQAVVTVRMLHEHSWSYTASGNVVTAKCSADKCPSSTATITLNAPAELVYSGMPKEATVTVEPAGVIAVGDIAYSAEPINAGDYTASITVGGVEAKVDFTITPMSITVPGNGAATAVYGTKLGDLTITGLPDEGDGLTFTWTMDGEADTVLAAGEHALTATGIINDNYNPIKVDVKVTITPKDLSAAVITLAEGELIYTGENLTQGVTSVVLDGVTLVDGTDYTVSGHTGVNAGDYTLTITGAGNYTGTAAAEWSISAAAAAVTAAAEQAEYTYGDTITVTATAAVSGEAATFSLRSAPAADQMALFLGETQLSDAVDAVNGVYTMTYNTAGKALLIGQNKLTVKYVGNGNLGDQSAEVMVTLNAKALTPSISGAASKVYDGTTAVADGHSLTIALNGVVDADAVAASASYAYADADVGTAKQINAEGIALSGSDRGRYTLAATEVSANVGEITKAKLVSINAPVDITLTVYCATADDVLVQLPVALTYVSETGEVTVPVEWTITDYSSAPKATNTAAWTADASALANYDNPNGLPLSGSIVLTNAEGKAVTITARDVTLTYDGSTYDAAPLFAVDANAGEASYAIAPGGTGEAAISGSVLTFTKAGTIKVAVTTAAKGEYLGGSTVATITLNKGDTVADAPGAVTGSYGQTLSELSLPAGWAWADGSVVLSAVGQTSQKAVYTPEEPDLWNTVEADVSVICKSAALTVEGTATASGVYGAGLNELTVEGVTITAGGVPVAGKAVIDSEEVLEAGVHTCTAVFVPNENADQYDLTSVKINVTVTIAPKPVTAAITLTPAAGVYTGQAIEPAVTAKDGEAVIPAGEYTVTYANNVNVGAATVTLTDVDGGNYVVSGSAEFIISQSGTAVTAAADKASYVYGETITVTATAAAMGEAAAFSLRSAPVAGQMALFLGENQISDAVDAVNGVYTMTYDTARKALTIGSNTLTVKYVGSQNQADQTATVAVTLTAKPLTITGADAADRVYDGTTEVTITAVTCTGVVTGDDAGVAVSGLTGSISSADAGDYTAVTLPELSLTGADAAFYTITQPTGAVTTSVTITKAVLTAVTLPTDVELTAYYATAAQVIGSLPSTVTYTDADGNAFALDAAWGCSDFDAAPGAVNSFTWLVAAGSLPNHQVASGVATSGSIQVTNTDALPVTVTGKDASFTYNGQTYDVSGMFTIGENAGAPAYTLVSGEGSLSGSVLTIGKAGTFTIRLTTAAHDAYAAGEATATLTVAKGDLALTAPTGLTAVYGQSLSSVELPESDLGSWTWAEEDALVGDAGQQTHKIIFTPNDTDNWNAAEMEAVITVSKADVSLEGAARTFLGEALCDTFTYGETITVKVGGHVVMSLRSFAAPTSDQMALFYGDTQISEPVDAVNGAYVMTYATTDKVLPAGQSKITARYVGNDNVNGQSVDLAVTIKPAQLTLADVTLQNREYQPGNTQVVVTAAAVNGKVLTSDDVAAAVTAIKGTISSDQAGDYTAVTLPELSLTGADAAFYTFTQPTGAVAASVTITKATPKANTASGVVEPEIDMEYAPGLTLEDVVPTLPANAYNVPGTVTWDLPASTPVELDKEYAWTFTPEDTDNYLPVTGTTVIFPMGDKPAVTAPAQAQTVTVTAGETATMTITAADADAYQWYIDRNDGRGYQAIGGANTNTYTTTETIEANSGYLYYCQVSNAYGTADSPVFTLEVIPEVEVPATGDGAQPMLWLALLLMSVTGLTVIANGKRRMN